MAVDEGQPGAPGDLAHGEAGAEQNGAAAADHERALPGAQEGQERVPQTEADGGHLGRAAHAAERVAWAAHRTGLARRRRSRTASAAMRPLRRSAAGMRLQPSSRPSESIGTPSTLENTVAIAADASSLRSLRSLIPG